MLAFVEIHNLKPSRKPRSIAAITVLTMAVVRIAIAAQGLQISQSAADNPPARLPRTFPTPTNLNVLPKDLTGQQVHDIMEQWDADLGVQCSACHIEEPNNVISGAPPRPLFADDSKEMKEVARHMYTMTKEINSNYIAKVEGSGKRVTCGTCHRGHVGPKPFTVQPPGGPPPIQIPPN